MHGQPPVIIEPYGSAWPKRFESERLLLVPVLAPWLAGPIEHVGSTASPPLASIQLWRHSRIALLHRALIGGAGADALQIRLDIGERREIFFYEGSHRR
jgi:GrpB protein